MQAQLKTLLPALRRFAFSLTGSLADADDLVQITLEKLLKKPIPEGVELMAWAFKVCRNSWIDEYRAQAVRNAATDKPELQQQSVSDDSAADDKVDLAKVTQAMNQLPPQQREVLGLIAVQGMSYQDAAEVLAIPTGTIMSRLARAREKLIKILNLERGALA